MRDERGFDSHTLQILQTIMTTATYNMQKAQEIADHLLGKEGMSRYPSMLLIGLLLISFIIRKYMKKIPVFE